MVRALQAQAFAHRGVRNTTVAPIVPRKAQRKTLLSEALRTERLQSFYTFLWKAPKEHTIILNYDEIPASFSGLLRNAGTLEHRGTENVMVALDDKHFKRMGTLVASLAVKKEGDALATQVIKPALILKQNRLKFVSNPNNLLVTGSPTGMITSDYMKDHFIPNLLRQLQVIGGKTLVVMDSASAHLSPSVLRAFRTGGCHCAVIPGGLTMFIQAIDISFAAKYRGRQDVSHHPMELHGIAGG